MDVGKVLKPGDKGTKNVLRIYGDKLVCVRYRYDRVKKKRFTTAEIIIDEKPWFYSPVSLNSLKPKLKPRSVFIRVSFSETELRLKIKSLGGKWHPHIKGWEIDYEEARRLQLEERIIQEVE